MILDRAQKQFFFSFFSPLFVSFVGEKTDKVTHFSTSSLFLSDYYYYYFK